MGATPHHDAEQALEVGRIHEDDHLIRCQILLLYFNSSQLPLYPLRTPSVLPRDLCVSLFAVGEFMPDLLLS